jgi:REP element-mobilizing transposase RayT
MARAWRIEYPGALYHVLSRGNERRDIFFDDRDRHLFLTTLGEMSQRFGVEIFAYALMPNHYHLLMRTHRPNLSRSMHWFGVTYTNRLNARHNRTGHLFQGRFKSILVENDAYLIQLSCYIHRNPLRAGMVERLADYPWSSYLAYAYGLKPPEWLSTELILSSFGGRSKHLAYRQKVRAYAREEKSLWEDFRHGLFLGSKGFIEQMRKKYLPENPHSELPQQRSLARLINPQELLERAAQEIGCDVEIVRRSRRISPTFRDDRDVLVYFMWTTGILTNAQIGQIFGLTYSSISHIVKGVKDRLAYERELGEKIERIHSQFKI